MTRKATVFGPLVLNQVRIMLAKGKNGNQIANELEVDADSLRAACNRAGIPLRGQSETPTLKVAVTSDIYELLRKEARIRGRVAGELAAEIIMNVVGDGLFSAVLDK